MEVASLDRRGSELAVCVSEEGGSCTVDIGLIPDVVPGESILVHAGAALARLPSATPERR
jgi:hypothetical protein